MNINILVGFKKKQYKDYISLKNKFNELIDNEKYYYLLENKIPYYFGEFEKLKNEFYYTIEFEINLVSYKNYKKQLEKLKKEVK